MSFTKKNILEKVVDLFQKEPQYRDDRWATMKLITEKIREELPLPLLSEWGLVQLAFDVDRSFRYVQQHIPSLRGRTWLLRQRMAGEISEEEYQNHVNSIELLRDIAKDNDMPFQGNLFEGGNGDA